MGALRAAVGWGMAAAVWSVACADARRPVPDAATTHATAEPASSAPSPAAAPPPSSPAAPPEPPKAEPPPAPKVKVVTIGMRVGGGPYDEITKEPIKRSVEPHFADLARCWTHVSQPKQADVGVDLVIEAAGGRAKVSNPRSTAAGAGEGFVPCVVAFYEGVDFQKPKNGKTVVSYSVRFIP